MEPGLGASRCSKVLGLPKMAGRLREMAEFTTDGWLQRCAFRSGKTNLESRFRLYLESRESRSVAVVGA